MLTTSPAAMPTLDDSTAVFAGLLPAEAPVPAPAAVLAHQDAQLRACLARAQAWLRATAGGVPRSAPERAQQDGHLPCQAQATARP
jgi:hypothetical protein